MPNTADPGETRGAGPVRPDVSVCIATYRRPHGLRRLLDSLARQKLPADLRIEILVVDNDAAGAARAGLPEGGATAADVRWFVEPRQNIALARNRALEAARGRYVAFIDDDEEAREDWLASFWTRVRIDEADGFFGPVVPRLAVPPKPWLDVAAFFSRRRHPSGTPLGVAEVSTSNALVRRAAVGDLRFDPAWGRTGGEDVELFDRMSRSGARFVWCDEAVVVETIPADRYRLRWLTRRAFNGGVGHTRLLRRRAGAAGAAFTACRAAAIGIAATALLPVASLAGPRAAVRLWLRACTQIGHVWAAVGGVYIEYRGASGGDLRE